MYHFSLNLLRDPLNWLTNWADGTESERIRGNLWSTPQPVTSPNVLRPASRETSYLRERPVGCFSTFLFFWGSISLHQIQLDWPLIYYYPPLLYLWAGSLSLTGWKTHCTFVFSSRTCFYISRAAVQKSHPQNKDIIAFLWYVHTVFSCQGYLGFFSAAGCAYHLFWMAARECRKSEERRFNKLVMFFSEEFVFTSRRGTSTHPPDSHFL